MIFVHVAGNTTLSTVQRFVVTWVNDMNCSKCGNKIYLQCSDDEPHRISGEPVCKDCYFEELGAFIEKHPIGLPPGVIYDENSGTLKTLKTLELVERIEDRGKPKKARKWVVRQRGTTDD